MSGNSERELQGAMNCPKCGFRDNEDGVINQEYAYYVLHGDMGRHYGYLNAKMGLEDYGGEYRGIINFERYYIGHTTAEFRNFIKYLQCPLCDTFFEKDTEVFKYYLNALDQGEYIFVE